MTETPVELVYSDIPLVATRTVAPNPWAVALKDVADGTPVLITISEAELDVLFAAVEAMV